MTGNAAKALICSDDIVDPAITVFCRLSACSCCSKILQALLHTPNVLFDAPGVTHAYLVNSGEFVEMPEAGLKEDDLAVAIHALSSSVD